MTCCLEVDSNPLQLFDSMEKKPKHHQESSKLEKNLQQYSKREQVTNIHMYQETPQLLKGYKHLLVRKYNRE